MDSINRGFSKLGELFGQAKQLVSAGKAKTVDLLSLALRQRPTAKTTSAKVMEGGVKDEVPQRAEWAKGLVKGWLPNDQKALDSKRQAFVGKAKGISNHRETFADKQAELKQAESQRAREAIGKAQVNALKSTGKAINTHIQALDVDHPANNANIGELKGILQHAQDINKHLDHYILPPNQREIVNKQLANIQNALLDMASAPPDDEGRELSNTPEVLSLVNNIYMEIGRAYPKLQ